MANPPPKSLPFALSAAAPGSLTDQLVTGFRLAIARGHYRAGERLPTYAQTSAALGVSQIVVRRAIARLAREGLVVPQHGRGVLVADGGAQRWLAHLAHIHWAGTRSYFHAVFNLALHEYLQARRVLPLSLLASPHELDEDFPATRTLLESQPITLALVDGLGDGLVSWLAQTGIPFVHLTHHAPHPAATCGICLDRSAQQWQVARLAAATGARQVLWLSGGRDPNPLTRWLAADGIACHLLHLDARRCRLPDQLSRLAYERLALHLGDQPRPPDLVFFDDDVVAVGGLLALQQAGLRIPADVQVVTWSNRGHTPIFPVPLTRFELDPAELAREVGDVLLAIASAPATPLPGRYVRPTFHPGRTLRLSPAQMTHCRAWDPPSLPAVTSPPG